MSAGNKSTELKCKLDKMSSLSLRERLKMEERIAYETDRVGYLKSQTKTRTAMIFTDEYLEEEHQSDKEQKEKQIRIL